MDHIVNHCELWESNRVMGEIHAAAAADVVLLALKPGTGFVSYSSSRMIGNETHTIQPQSKFATSDLPCEPSNDN